MLATFVLTLAALDTCASCRMELQASFLCEPHAEAERAALARETRRLAAKEEAERLAALDALAALTEAHTNAPSERVAKRIAQALDDDSLAVRARAVERLGRPQHALVAVDALTEALEDAWKLKREWGKEYKGLVERSTDKLSDAKREKLGAERAALGARIDDLNALHRQLVTRLAEFPDERALDAILANTARNLIFEDGEALARIGTRRALDAFVDGIRIAEDNLASLARERDEVVEKANGITTLATAVAVAAYDSAAERVAARRARLVELLAERGLVAPGPSATVRDWGRWLAENRDAIPDRLPGITSPAW